MADVIRIDRSRSLPEAAVDVGRRSRPANVVLGVLLVLLTIGVEAALFHTARGLSTTSASFAKASRVTTYLANVQREAIMLQAEAAQLDGTEALERLSVRRMLLERQLGVVEVDGDSEILGGFRAIRRELKIFDAHLARLGPHPTHEAIDAKIPEAIVPLGRVEALLKDLYDGENRVYNALTLRALRSRASSQRLLVGLGVLVLALGGLLAGSVWRGVRSDFHRAYLALRRQFDERRAAEEALRASEERFRSMVQNSSDVVTIVDADGVIAYQTPSAERLFGWEPSALVGTPFWRLVHPDDRSRVLAFLRDGATHPGMATSAEWRMKDREGNWRHSETLGANLLEDPNVAGFVLNTRDVSERRILQDTLAHKAFHDSLTDLANRAMFEDRVGHALARSDRSGLPVAILLLDLDDFKRVNDSMGHASGDQLLLAVAERIKACLRPSDTAARLGGDEFAILVEDTAEPEAVLVAERILDALSDPFAIEGREIYVRASIGVAIGAGGRHTTAELLRDADVAMYSVKTDHKGRHQVFRPELYAEALRRIELEADLRAAVDRNEFVVHLQPIVRLGDRAVVAVEALARWRHPTRGLLSPADFIPVAEETGLIVPIGRQIMEQAAAALRVLRASAAELEDLTMTVNVSARQLQDPQFVSDVAETVVASGIDASSFVLEITESVLMKDVDASAELAALKRFGVKLAIDDFGSGYSSLAYLRQLPVDILKVDKAFVEGVGSSAEQTAFMAAVRRLAGTLRLDVIVEGVETSLQAAALAKIGYEMAQGWHFSHPVPLEDLVARFGSRHSLSGAGELSA